MASLFPSSNNTNDMHEEKDLQPPLTLSQIQQLQTEDECAPFFVDLTTLPASQREHLRETGLLSLDGEHIQLLSQTHRGYLHSIAEHPLPASFVTLDSSRPWMMYWCWHACDLLNQWPDPGVQERTVTSLRDCFTQCTVELPQTLVQQDARLQTLWNMEQQQQRAEPHDTTTRGPEEDSSRTVVTFTNAGGFGGGVDQMPHAATTYAAVLCLCLLQVPSAVQLLEQIRWQLYPWLWSLLVVSDDNGNGRFRMHQDGELDLRATYCVLVVAKLLNLWPDHWRTTTTTTKKQPVVATPSDVAKAVCHCQTWEGGLAGEPGGEAHGGYTYCGVAALYLLDSLHHLDLDSLLGWLARRQMSYEGGYSGRSNKLVDGCYSFWQGSAVVLTSWVVQQQQQQQQQKSDENKNHTTEPRHPEDPWLVTSSSEETSGNTTIPKSTLFNAAPLERYILLCCQDVNGGLRDKPSKVRDFYHSCYCLSGLALAQQYAIDPHYPSHNCHLPRTHPTYNLRVEHVMRILRHFESLDNKDHKEKTSSTTPKSVE